MVPPGAGLHAWHSEELLTAVPELDLSNGSFAANCCVSMWVTYIPYGIPSLGKLERSTWSRRLLISSYVHSPSACHALDYLLMTRGFIYLQEVSCPVGGFVRTTNRLRTCLSHLRCGTLRCSLACVGRAAALAKFFGRIQPSLHSTLIVQHKIWRLAGEASSHSLPTVLRCTCMWLW